MRVRGAGAAAGVAAATGALTAVTAVAFTLTSWAAEPEAAEPAVTKVGPMPSGAAVSRRGPAAGKKLELIKEKQRRQAAAAARAAAQRRERAARSASRSVSYSGDPRGIGASMAASRYGWGADQFSCLDALWTRESGWNPRATNPSSGAYGIPQALPGSKMSAYGADWRTNPVTQIEWGLAYIDGRYGSPCGAWNAFQSKGWY